MPYPAAPMHRRPRFSPVTFLTAALIVLGYLRWTAAPELTPWDPLTPEERRAGLGRVIDELPLVDAGFADTLAAVSRKTGARVSVDPMLHERVMVSGIRKANFRLRNITTGRAIELAIDYFALDPGTVTWRVDGEMVRIIPAAELGAAPLVTRVYDVSDVIASAAARQRRQGSSQYAQYRPEPLGNAVPIQPAPPDLESVMARHLLTTLLQTVEPDSWQHLGGAGRGRAACVGYRLVITHTPRAHHRVGTFLHMLRQTEAGAQ